MFFKKNSWSIISILLAFTLLSCQRIKLTDSKKQAESPIEPVAQVNRQKVRVGILNITSAASLNERYRPLLDYLEQALDLDFELVSLSQESQFTQVAESNLQFVINNPLAAVQIRRLYDTEFLVTQSRHSTGTLFSGLVIVKQDSEISDLADLKGKKVACVNFQTAAAGCVFQIYHLKQQGIDPFQDFADFIENKSQDNIVLAVLNDTVDAGFIRTGQLEKMVANGLINSVDELKILDRADDDFYYAHTTALYPEWPVAALKSTNPQLVAEVKQALLAMPAQHPALDAAKLAGFVAVADYGSLDLLIENLQLKSWDKN